MGLASEVWSAISLYSAFILSLLYDFAIRAAVFLQLCNLYESNMYPGVGVKTSCGKRIIPHHFPKVTITRLFRPFEVRIKREDIYIKRRHF